MFFKNKREATYTVLENEPHLNCSTKLQAIHDRLKEMGWEIALTTIDRDRRRYNRERVKRPPENEGKRLVFGQDALNTFYK